MLLLDRHLGRLHWSRVEPALVALSETRELYPARGARAALTPALQSRLERLVKTLHFKQQLRTFRM
jgi:hypothetical protein